jgi:hypothetical protein
MADGKKGSSRDTWLEKISDEDKAHKVWRDRAKSAEEAYCRFDETEASPEFPVYYTTVQLLLGRISGSPPKPDVRKRHPSSPQASAQSQPNMAGLGAPQPVQAGTAVPGAPPQSPMGPPVAPNPGPGMGQSVPGMGAPPNPISIRLSSMAAAQATPGMAPVADPIADDNIISMALERCLSYTVDTTTFSYDGNLGVRDFLVAGLGNCKVEMETETDLEPVVNPMTGLPVLDEDGEPIQQEVISSQCLFLRHFHHSQFRWEPAKDWRQVKWVSFDHFMTKDDIEEQFDVELDSESTGPGSGAAGDQSVSIKAPQMDKYEGTYTVHEIWDKRKLKRLFVSDCYPEILEEEDDPLELDNFFPCPMPMMANVNGREYIPCPDYWQYSFLVKQCNELSRRIKDITEQVKDIKFYDSSFSELKQASQYPDGTFIAVKQLLDKLRSTSGNADSSSIIFELDMKSKVEVLQALSGQLDAFKARIYEINGIADIQRGVSNPNDTATAQNIKNEWADIRTGQRVQVVALFFRDVFRIMSELIAKRFARPQIEAMCGIQLSDSQISVMRSDLATAYSIDVESDSTMVQNDSQNVAQISQFLQALEPLMQTMLPGMQSGAVPGDLGKEIFSMVVDAYKPGRDLQQSVEALPDTLKQLSQLTQSAQQAQQQSQQLQQQNQQLQNQLQQHTQAADARENARVQADVQSKGVQDQHTQAKTQLLTSDLPGKSADANKTTADTAKTAAEAAITARQNTLEAMTTGIQ